MPAVKEDEVVSTPRPRAWVVGAAWLGLCAGWLELAGLGLQQVIDPRISMNSLRINDHFFWMIPFSDMLLLGAVGLMLGALARNRPRLAHLVGWRTLLALATAAIVLTVHGLGLYAAISLACGIGVVLGRVIEQRAERFAQFARRTMPLLGGPVVILAIVSVLYQRNAEGIALARLPAAENQTPNVVFIVLDNVRASSLRLYGHQRPTSPNLERLAKRGVVFEHARSTASWTLASHASMFTGQWSSKLAIDWYRGLDEQYPTLAEHLASNGYATAGFVGNTYYCNSRYGLDRGFARYEDYYENERVSLFEVIHSSALGRGLLWCFRYNVNVEEGGNAHRKTAAMLNQDALRWLDARPRDRPFFVFLNYFDAHSPFIPPEGPGPRFGSAALSPNEKVEILKRNQRFIDGRPRPGDGPRETAEREALSVLLDGYETCIASLDHQLGALFDQLDQRGLTENTLVVITSDHGEHFNERGFLGHGMSVYEREVHVPLVVVPPGKRVVPPGFIKTPVSLRDLPATVVDLVGLEGGTPFPGRSLARFWANGQQRGPQVASLVLSEVEPRPECAMPPGIARALVTDGKVYVRAPDGQEELYDLATDPFETHNLLKGTDAHSVDRYRGLLGQVLRGPGWLETASSDAAGSNGLGND